MMIGNENLEYLLCAKTYLEERMSETKDNSFLEQLNIINDEINTIKGSANSDNQEMLAVHSD